MRNIGDNRSAIKGSGRLEEAKKKKKSSKVLISVWKYKWKHNWRFKKVPKGRITIWTGEIKSLWMYQAAFCMTQVYRWNSSAWVQKNLNWFQQISSIFCYCLLSSSSFWAKWRLDEGQSSWEREGLVSQPNRWLQALYLEGSHLQHRWQSYTMASILTSHP